MHSPEVGPEFHLEPEITIQVPVSELLQDPVEVAALWPELSLQRQVEQHRTDVSTICSVIDCLPDPTVSIEEALTTRYVNETQVTHLYDTLSSLLQDPDYQRLALYLPLEFLPDATWQPTDPVLGDAVDRFVITYLYAWKNLLGSHDVRANFVDGDVLEEEQRSGDHPRVVKAAHLIPELVERGLLGEKYISNLLLTDDSVLRQSINEALNSMYNVESSFPTRDARSLGEKITDRRRAWLEQQDREKSINATAQHVARAMQQGEPTHKLYETLLATSEPNTASLIIAEGIYQAIKSLNKTDTNELYTAQLSLLQDMWEMGNVEVKDQLASVFRRLYRAGLAPIEDLSTLGINVPSLDGPFSENLQELSADIQVLSKLTRTIETTPELSKFLLPVVLVGGSKLKGYGGLGSDVDVSVFIKPDTPHDAHEYIRQQLDSLFVHGSVRYEPMEFWLENSDELLKIHDFTDPTIHTADSYWTHTLFEGAWVGDKQIINMLQQKLLPGYFQDTKETVDGVSKRQLYLERLEQDVLQYRLMHKGYQRHYPLQYDPVKTIDKSVFWDPGYRQLATKLFVRNVFLPKLHS